MARTAASVAPGRPHKTTNASWQKSVAQAQTSAIAAQVKQGSRKLKTRRRRGCGGEAPVKDLGTSFWVTEADEKVKDDEQRDEIPKTSDKTKNLSVNVGEAENSNTCFRCNTGHHLFQCPCGKIACLDCLIPVTTNTIDGVSREKQQGIIRGYS